MMILRMVTLSSKHIKLLKGHLEPPVSDVTFLLKSHPGPPMSGVMFLIKVIMSLP